MHCVAVTKENVVFTWGVNDDGALGRDTHWAAPTRDASLVGSDSESDNDDSGLNPLESTPIPVPARAFEGNPKWAQVAATDSACFALTTTGEVYGWGCFNGIDGPIGFSLAKKREGALKQRTPLKIPDLTHIISLTAGGNHMLALDESGNVWSWGDGSQFQLGRPVSEKYRDNCLRPVIQQGLYRKNTVRFSAGGYHSFAIDRQDRVWSWGLNNYGQTRISANAGEDGAAVRKPTIVKNLSGKVIGDIAGGAHHSLVCTNEGAVFSWGRCDDGQPGISIKDLAAEEVLGGKILLRPTEVPVSEVAIRSVAACIDNSLPSMGRERSLPGDFLVATELALVQRRRSKFPQ